MVMSLSPTASIAAVNNFAAARQSTFQILYQISTLVLVTFGSEPPSPSIRKKGRFSHRPFVELFFFFSFFFPFFLGARTKLFFWGEEAPEHNFFFRGGGGAGTKLCAGFGVVRVFQFNVAGLRPATLNRKTRFNPSRGLGI